MTINSFWLYYNTAYSYLPGQVSPYSWHCHKYVGTINTQGNKVGSTGYKNITLFLLRNILPSKEKALVYSFYCMTNLQCDSLLRRGRVMFWTTITSIPVWIFCDNKNGWNWLVQTFLLQFRNFKNYDIARC